MERTIQTILHGTTVTEGAGVRLNRIFGYYEAGMFDPFLMLDDFSSDTPSDFTRGFPWHPHRGIETITYILRGDVEHSDSLGNKGIISDGDIQWMKAGSGIIHQEMPKGDKEGAMHGFQLWANLPAKLKMTAPNYCGLTNAEIPSIQIQNGITAKIIAGKLENTTGPVEDIAISPNYFDIKMPPETIFKTNTNKGDTVFVYIINGNGHIDNKQITSKNLILFNDGEHVSINSGKVGLHFLFISGKPLKEPIAWRGPIVMNTDEELNVAFKEYADGTFIKHNGNAK